MAGFSWPIHGARGVFALAVVLFHVHNSGLPALPVPSLVQQGFGALKFGVELFFAISGFVIVGTMARARSPLAFIGDRATRIYPVLWAVLPVAIPAMLLAGDTTFDGQGPLASLGIVIGNFLALGPVLPVPVIYGVAWTLSYEFAFYLLGFAVLLGRRRALDLTWLALLVGLSYCVFAPRALFFLAGVLVATGLAEQSPLRHLSRAPGLCLIAFLGLWQATSNDTSPHIDPVYQWGRAFHWLTGPLAFLAATAAINGLAQGRGMLSQLLQSRPLLWLGTISYSLYIWHPLVLGTCKSVMHKLHLSATLGNWSQPFFLLATLPPCLLIAWISARLLEGRVTGWLRRRLLAGDRDADKAVPAALV
ncbi:acyltransferase family protein [Paracoccus limosus]|uniref:Acyltransferase family protein n=1 Tax=Paracoccus limosus TaxID=913252 RepID=A0A844HAI6_9RHOB|nr:acyltransferase family protein [Paracoccus limosus]